MAGIQKMKGFADMFTPDSDVFTFIESTARRVFSAYGYSELRTPLLEHTELFSRSIGLETDVVQKEMYTFPDRKGRSLTLRPEATAGVLRAYIESARSTQESVSKFFSTGPMFRYERPQKGRMRQFHQVNCECLGAPEPLADAEVILMLMTFLGSLGLTGLTLEINSLGCKQCRPGYKDMLTQFLAAIPLELLCPDCCRRLHTNPLRVLDCKAPGCCAQTENAPRMAENNCPECRKHFATVLRILDGASLPYILNPRLVRGLDYYCRTTFEVVSATIGAQDSVAGGGRYDGLVAQLGGPDIPGAGFACGMERLALMLGTQPPRTMDFYLAVMDENALEYALLLAQKLRSAGRSGEVSFAAKSLKSQLRQASRLGAKKCLILGGNEMVMNMVTVKDMETGDQETVPAGRIAQYV